MKILFALLISLFFIPVSSTWAQGNNGNFKSGNSNASYTRYYTYIKHSHPEYYRDVVGRWGICQWFWRAGPESSFYSRNRLGYFSHGYPIFASGPRNYHTYWRN